MLELCPGTFLGETVGACQCLRIPAEEVESSSSNPYLMLMNPQVSVWYLRSLPLATSWRSAGATINHYPGLYLYW